MIIVPAICPKVILSPRFEDAKKNIGKKDKSIGVIKLIEFILIF